MDPAIFARGEGGGGRAVRILVVVLGVTIDQVCDSRESSILGWSEKNKLVHNLLFFHN